jgi:hypothetical protein
VHKINRGMDSQEQEKVREVEQEVRIPKVIIGRRLSGLSPI